MSWWDQILKADLVLDVDGEEHVVPINQYFPPVEEIKSIPTLKELCYMKIHLDEDKQDKKKRFGFISRTNDEPFIALKSLEVPSDAKDEYVKCHTKVIPLLDDMYKQEVKSLGFLDFWI